MTPLGQCCPVCSSTTVEPETKQPEETEQPTVNTEATTISEPATGKPCDIDGAVPVRCASPCPATCTRPLVICEAIVCDIPRLCECPSGQVVDEVHNRCVPQDDCPPAGVQASTRFAESLQQCIIPQSSATSLYGGFRAQCLPYKEASELRGLISAAGVL